MKPTCPDCGAATVNVYYRGVVQISSDGTVTFGGVTGGQPYEWDCGTCEAVERTDHLDVLADQVFIWTISLGCSELESGIEMALVR